MLLSFNWQIIENFPQNEQQLNKIKTIPLPEEQNFFGQDSQSNTMQPISLRSPLFGFVFSYYIQQPKINPPEIELVPEVSLPQGAAQLRITSQLRTKNCIFLSLLIESSEVYDVLLVLSIRVRYHPGPKPPHLGSIPDLLRLSSYRQLILSPSTYTTIRKQIIIDSPVTIQHTVKQGLLLLRLSRADESGDQVQIICVEVMNWLAKGSESIRKDKIEGLIKGRFKLAARQCYCLPFKIQNSWLGVEVPVAISFTIGGLQNQFKMVATLKGQRSS